MATNYAHPEVLVSTDWVNEHRKETDKIRIVESDEDVLLYETGHIPEAVKIDWMNDLVDPVVRDYLKPEAFGELCARCGIANDTTLVFYGDKNNWWACYAFWVFKLYGHEKCLVMNGGRAKWLADGKPMSKDKPKHARTTYKPKPHDKSIRAFRDEVLAHMKAGRPMVDVRSPQEYSGERTHMPDYPQEGALRAGHIPGAKGIPWARAVKDDGTFRSADELTRIYCEENGLKPADETVAYCRIGERSSHTWFVLKYLLGFPKVRNYDGSWTEWGNAVAMPIEKTYGAGAKG
jgi:thiosulfate/3-mercaptopyruvate sulfurtransferase